MTSLSTVCKAQILRRLGVALACIKGADLLLGCSIRQLDMGQGKLVDSRLPSQQVTCKVRAAADPELSARACCCAPACCEPSGCALCCSTRCSRMIGSTRHRHIAQRLPCSSKSDLLLGCSLLLCLLLLLEAGQRHLGLLHAPGRLDD